VKVVSATVVRSSEGAAAVVTLRNLSSHPLRTLPIAVTVKDVRGAKPSSKTTRRVSKLPWCRSRILRRTVVFMVARRSGQIVAAGRAVHPEVAARSPLPFQVFFIGDPRGARLRASAPATTVG
jgi:hypothetical protein